jgi:subtilisin family serine protease
MIRAEIPVIKRFACLFLAALFILASVKSGHAARSARPSISSTQSAFIAAQSQSNANKSVRLAQTYNRLDQTTTGRYPPTPTPTPPPGGKPPDGSGKTPNTGGGISIGNDIGNLLQPRQPPRRVSHPAKKVYLKPAQRIVRRPPQRPTGPLVVQPIPQFVPDHVTVLIRNQPDSLEDELAQRLGLTVVSSSSIALLDGQVVTFRVQAGQALPPVIASLTSDPRIEHAQSNNIYLTSQQRSRSAGSSAQYALAKLGLGTAHNIAQGRGVTVAVIDTGVDASHPVLSSAVARSFDAVADGKPDVEDHGTAIAGLIAGQGKVKGVAPAASVLAVRAFYMHQQYKRPLTTSDILIRALDWSFANGARVFNMSFTGPYDPLVQAALQAAHERGVVLVAAAGNGGPKAPPAYPAAYKNVIAITALDRWDKLYAHANRGGYLAAAAPGVEILVPALKKAYRFSSGTSIAAAHVSGLVALLLEKNPDATADEIVNVIEATAHDLGPKGHDVQFGAGRANAIAALQSLGADAVMLTSGR